MRSSVSFNGAVAGGLAAALWAAEQPLDKRVFGSQYDDLELLGKAVTRRAEWPWFGLALHVQNGALFGAAYAHLKPFLVGPPALRGVTAALIENFALWPLGALVDRYHPARGDIAPLGGNLRALAQSTWRHAFFGAVLGLLEQRLNAARGPESRFVPASSNGHGDIERAAAMAS